MAASDETLRVPRPCHPYPSHRQNQHRSEAPVCAVRISIRATQSSPSSVPRVGAELHGGGSWWASSGIAICWNWTPRWIAAPLQAAISRHRTIERSPGSPRRAGWRSRTYPSNPLGITEAAEWVPDGASRAEIHAASSVRLLHSTGRGSVLATTGQSRFSRATPSSVQVAASDHARPIEAQQRAAAGRLER